MLTDQQKRIAKDLRQGVSAVPKEAREHATSPALVHVQAQCVLIVLDALDDETARADAAEAALPSVKGDPTAAER